MSDTIFALSSGQPPAAIAIIRISGPKAAAALLALTGRMPEPRRAQVRALRDADGDMLDTAMVLWFPGPRTATGEDLAELHCHGGRAVVAAIEAALTSLSDLRPAEPGEFTRRAFTNGRIDLAEAEGLADLLSAETELQRRNAVSLSEGVLSRQVTAWRDTVLVLSSIIEAELDFADEDDATSPAAGWHSLADRLASDLQEWLARPAAELLRDGIRVVLAGPPNAGKSTLFNALVGSDAAIITSIAGTTRDILTRPVALAGVPFVFADTAGLRDDGDDPIERIGMARAREVAADADIVLWLGPEGQGPQRCWEIEACMDASVRVHKRSPRHRLSALTGDGVASLRTDLIDTARKQLPRPGEVALNHRQRALLTEAHRALVRAIAQGDLLLIGEELRQVRLAFDLLLGRSGVENMLDTLFGRFCIGK